MLYRRLLWRARVKGKVSEFRVDQYGDTIDVYCLPEELEKVTGILATAPYVKEEPKRKPVRDGAKHVKRKPKLVRDYGEGPRKVRLCF